MCGKKGGVVTEVIAACVPVGACAAVGAERVLFWRDHTCERHGERHYTSQRFGVRV